MQYLQVQGQGWNNGLINLSVKIEAQSLVDFIKVRVIGFLRKKPIEDRQELIQFLDLAIRLLQPSLGTSDLHQDIKSAYDKLNVIKIAVSKYQPEEITEDKIYNFTAKSLAILEELGCVFPDWPEQTVQQINTISPLDDIRQSLE